jgi:hypothetical protein
VISAVRPSPSFSTMTPRAKHGLGASASASIVTAEEGLYEALTPGYPEVGTKRTVP